jgi:hypothetical protein
VVTVCCAGDTVYVSLVYSDGGKSYIVKILPENYSLDVI